MFCPCVCRSSNERAWDKDAKHVPGVVSAISGMPQPDLDAGSGACSLCEVYSGPSSSSSQRLRISSRAAVFSLTQRAYPMKLSLLAAAAAAASVSPPVITLDLDGQALTKRDAARSGLPSRPTNGVGFKEAGYSKVCAVQQANSNTCKLPTAKAYDHHDGSANYSLLLLLLILLL